jgi:calcium permeable stress-gated cation channel
LGSTFVPVAVYTGICLILFIALRRKCLRVYSPKTISDLRHSSSELSPQLPNGWFNWIVPFLRIPQSDVLKYASLDGFLFLRYLQVLALLCFGGACFAWPILLPLHATGGEGLLQLDLLTIGNVDTPSKYYAHVLTAWCFFGEWSASPVDSRRYSLRRDHC